MKLQTIRPMNLQSFGAAPHRSSAGGDYLPIGPNGSGKQLRCQVLCPVSSLPLIHHCAESCARISCPIQREDTGRAFNQDSSRLLFPEIWPMKCKRLPTAELDHHTLQVMRQAVKAVRDGQTVQSVAAAAYGVNERSVFRWLADFANGGQNALLAKPIPGRPSKLSAEELSWIANAVRDHNPQQFKFEFGLWTLSLIRHLIKRQFKKELSVSSVHRLMKILGFSAQKPLYQAWQQDPVLVRTWETETYPRFALKPSGSEQRSTLATRSGIRSDYHTGTTWAPQGRTPVVQATGRRFAEHDLGRRHAGRISGSCCMRDRSVRKCSSSSSSA